VEAKGSKFAFGEFRLDPGNFLLFHGHDRIALAPKPFEILCYLAERPGELVTKDELLDAIWPNVHISESGLSVRINTLRTILGDDPNEPRFIETVKRRGYRFIAAVTIIPFSKPAPTSLQTTMLTDLPGGVQTPKPLPIARIVRKTWTIMAIDVVGYTRLMEIDEEGTLAQLILIRSETLVPTINEHKGNIVKYSGDGILAVFDTAAQSVRCAVSMQRRLIERATRFPMEQRITFRIGLNTAEPIFETGDIYGEGVNVAMRLQAYAEPGDVIMSAAVAEQSSEELAELDSFDMGDLYLKNISASVRAVGIRIGSICNLTGPAPPKRSADVRPSIAVMPFRSDSSEQIETYFANGIVEEIIHVLAALKELFVISRTSTLRYTETPYDVRAISRELGVHYLLFGSVSRFDDQLRIRTELVDAASEQVIQSDRYECKLADLFELQRRIGLAAMRTIAPNVLERELQRSIGKHPENLTAYDLVLQALENLYRLGYESHARARGLLQQAIALAPDYAQAYAYIAYWHIFRVGEGWSTDPDSDAAEASRLARLAIERDVNNALALSIYGHVHAFLLRDFETANAILDRAIDVGPNCALAWTMSSITRGYLGEGTMAVERAEQGLRLAPIDGHSFWHEGMLAQAHYVNGDYEAAVAWARRAAASNASAMFNLRVLAASLAALGRKNDAGRVGKDIMRLQPGFRLSTYSRSCPFTGEILENWINRLRAAGLPD
jgi:adenylate cyclase